MRVILDETQRSVTLPAGEVFVLELAENPTTGYRWEIDVVGPVERIDDSYAVVDPGVGGGGRRTFSFRANEKGSATVHAVLRRRWEAAPVQEFTTTVNVVERQE